MHATATTTCLHCGTLTAGEDYCCVGCRAVHGLLTGRGLGHYYDLRGARVAPITLSSSDLKWLEALEAQVAAADGATRVELDLQGVQCAGCVWLLEELFTQAPGSLRAVVNPGVGRVELLVTREFSLRTYVQDVEKFGYALGPARKVENAREGGLLGRIGLCAALALNTMLFSLPLYLGLHEGRVHTVFRWLAFLLSATSVAVGAPVFFRGAWEGLRRGVLHLDVPIALGIALSFAGSTWAFAHGRDSGAFYDTLATFIALMLFGRWLQERVLSRNRAMLLASDGADALLTRRVVNGRVETVPCREIHVGDALLIAPQDLVPVAACLDEARASCSLDWINGESTPRDFVRGEPLPAGAFNVGTSAVLAIAQEDFEGSSLPALLRSTARGEEQARASGWWQRLTRVYVVLVLTVASLGFVMWAVVTGDYARALEVTTAILVVTCPCAFGLATPMAYELVQAGLRRAGIFVRSPSLLDRLPSVRNVVFDKTGTLTTGLLSLCDPKALAGLSLAERSALYNLASRSNHPQSAAVRRCLDAEELSFVPGLDVVEEAGCGMTLRADAAVWKLGRARWVAPETCTDDGLAFGTSAGLLARIETEERPRAHAAEEIASLQARGLKVWILSGDAQERVEIMARAVGVPAARALGGMSPEGKREWLATHDRKDTLMLGDGINDSLAVQEAFCSGTPAIDRPFMSARTDFYVAASGLAPVGLALDASRRLAQVNRRNLALAVGYNLATVAIALAGGMSPLLCAIVMPLTSLTILLATVAALSPGGALWKS